MGNENFMEELADSIYDQIVTENFKDLTTDEEQLVYEIACTKANEQFEQKKSYRTKIKARKFLSLIRRLAIKRRAEIMEQFKAAQKNNNETGNN